jgi:hypothetical protein
MTVKLKKNIYCKGGITFAGGAINKQYEAEKAYPDFDKDVASKRIVVYKDSTHFIATVVSPENVIIVKE